MAGMDLGSARFLAAAGGERLLAAARTTRERPAHLRVDDLAGLGTPEQVRLALQQDVLRQRAAARCPHADRLLFTPDALEQATAWAVAAERAGRWQTPCDVPLVDLGAGIGLDALATALSGRPVVAYERDPARACLLAHNARVLGVEDRVEVRQADVVTATPTGRLALLDPDRRPGGRRTRDPRDFAPPAQAWEGLLAGFGRALVKLPPHAPRGVEEGRPFEVVSLDGSARERRLFQGDWGPLAARRALRLPGGAHVEGGGEAWPEPCAVEAGAWLLDPDVAVTAAGLVGDLARRDGLRPVHPEVPYLVGSAALREAPGHWMRVDARLGMRPKVLNGWLRARGVGHLTIRKRGIAAKAQEWRKWLRPKGKRAGTLVFTRDLRDRWVAFGCFEEG